MTGEDKQKVEQLSLEIVRLEKMLELLYVDNKPLCEAQMVAISRLLDEKIIQYMKLQKQSEIEENT